MSPGGEQLLQAALALPEDERLEMIEALLAALDQGSSRPIDDTWMAEVRRRSAEFDAGKVKPIPWSEVKERARQGETPRG
jgi:putative addiction module component (TIGR02574 family)